MSEKVAEMETTPNILPSILIDDKPQILEPINDTVNILRESSNAKPKSNAYSGFSLEDSGNSRNASIVAHSRFVSTTTPSVADYDKLFARFKTCIAISNIDQQTFTNDHLALIKDFLLSPDSRKLVIYIDDQRPSEPAALQVVTSLPRQVYSQMAYFIKGSMAKNEILTDINFERKVQFGKLTKNTMESLLRIMSHVYVPIFLGNKKWPDTVRKEFNSQLHKFMALLTDTTYQIKGRTVLFVPEGYSLVFEEAARSKDVVQRLEALLVHWTKQIKEVLSAQHSAESIENLGPLEEIKFWKDRSENLSSISTQINRKDVKEITRVLEAVKSSFLEPFSRLSILVEEGTLEAHDNLKFLSVLSTSCRELLQLEPKAIPSLFPNLLHSVRLIWANSRFYNTKDRLTGILRKISNEIIKRCSSKISLEDIFHGDVKSASVVVQDSAYCGEAWKAAYKSTCEHVFKFTQKQWEFDQSSIFAQIDSFVRRCKDLLEVCESQAQFARKIEGGQKAPIPYFGGVRGPEVSKTLEDIEEAFEKQLGSLWNIRQFILDVKNTKWHDEYNSFKQGVKDLEVMMQNAILLAFEESTTVEGSVELLEVFHHLAIRDAVKRAVEKKTADVYQAFLIELNIVKGDFEVNKKTPSILRTQPDVAGTAYWAKALLLRIQSPMNALNSAYYLTPIGIMSEAKTQYELVSSALEDYISKSVLEWNLAISPKLSEKLNEALMVRVGGKLAVKFDKELLRLFAEITYMQRLKFDPPFHVQELYAKKEELRVLRENVALVARDYNKISEMLSPQELLLFKERIRFLDRKINPALTNLNWDSKGVSDFFIKECRKHLADAHKIVTEFITCNSEIQQYCKAITQIVLVQIEPKKIYILEEFEQSQLKYQAEVRAKLLSLVERIQSNLVSIYDIFRGDGAAVQFQWTKYIESIDMKIEQSLRTTVKKSLSEISKAINGDTSNGFEVQPLFSVNVVLESQKVEFSPTFTKLQENVNRISRDMISTITVVSRLVHKLAPNSPTMSTSFYDIISGDEDVLKMFVQIQSGMTNNASKCQAYLRNWDSYKEIWEINKDAFIRRYAKLKPALSTFDADINRYNEVGNNAQKEENLTNVNFVLLDCSPLKHSIVAHCSAWQSKLTTLLNQNAVVELNNLTEMLAQTTKKLLVEPKDVQELGESQNLLAEAQKNYSKVQSQFGPIKEMYSILETYEIAVKQEEKEKLQLLPKALEEYQKAIAVAEVQLQEAKEKFKSELLSFAEDYNKLAQSIKDEF